MTNAEIDHIEDILCRIIEYTKSPESRGFYQKAIMVIGVGQVEEALGEVRMRVNEGSVREPAKYLTTILKDWMAEAEEETPQNPPLPETVVSIQDNSRELALGLKSFRDLQERPHHEIEEEGEERTIDLPFSKKWLQWVRFVNNDFFSLSTIKNRAGWDQVITRLKIRGSSTLVPLIRGKMDPDDAGRGILTVEHARILGAIEHIWANQGFPHTTYEKSGISICFCQGSVRQIATILGIKTFGGSTLKHLRKKILDLDKTGYHFDLTQMEKPETDGIRSIGFKFLGDVTVISSGNKNRRESLFRFVFSESYSRQLLLRNVVSRPLDMLQIRGEIAFKLYQHLYPILIKKSDGKDYTVELRHLIELLGLPTAGWHKHKSVRKREFQKAVNEVNGKTVTDGREISVKIIDGLVDYVLTAQLIGAN